MRPRTAGTFLAGCLVVAGEGAPALSKQKLPDSIIEDLESPDRSRQDNAMSRIRSYHLRDVADAFMDYAEDSEPGIRVLMVQMLGDLGGPEAVPYLQKMFKKDGDARVRRTILTYLAGQLARDDIFRFFLKAGGRDPDGDLRYVCLAQLALARRSKQRHQEVRKLLRRAWKREAVPANRTLAAVLLTDIGEGDSDFWEEILDAVTSPSLDLRRRAAAVAGEVRLSRTFDRLLAAARDPDGEVRANVCLSLARWKELGSIPVLRSLAGDPEPYVRRAALLSLARYPSGSVGLGIFLDALGDADPPVRLGAVQGLQTLGDLGALAGLERAASDPDAKVREAARKAVESLEKIKK